MILNFHFNNFNGNQFKFDGPYMMLDRDCHYQIAIRHFHIELSTNQITKDNDLWVLSSNLVDRSPANTYQSISYFTLSRGKLNHDATPSPLVFYPLEIHQLDNPEFIIHRVNKDKQINIDHAFVQLEIIKE